MSPILIALAAVFGAVIGSFAGCCIYRIPRGQYYTYSDEELEALGDNIPPPVPFNHPPRSACPHCNTQLLWWHNIPMVSWLLLKGRCNFCGQSIPFRYFLVEGLTSLAATATLIRFGATPTAVIIFALLVALIILTFIDIDWFILPDVITLYGSLVAFIIVVINQFFSIFTDPIVADLWGSLYGVLAGAGFLYFVAQLYLWIRKIDGLGLGDVKLLLMTGILLGAESSIYAIFVGSIIGCIGGSFILLIQKKGISQSYIPFGPYLAGAICLYLFTGTWVLQKFSQLVGLFIIPLIGL